MLGVRAYPRDYVAACRAKVASDLAAYRHLASAAEQQTSVDGSPVSAALPSLDAALFNNMVLALDYMFVHRLRTIDGKDGNPLNEVRVLCDSILQHEGILTVDKSIKLAPAKSVLKYEFGQPIKLTEADFERLCEAFFAEIESKLT